MQDVFVQKPYEFVPRLQPRWPQWLLVRCGIVKRDLRREHGVVEHEIRDLGRLRKSLEAGHGIMVAANHPRTADPWAMAYVARDLKCPFYSMASWHLFNQGWVRRIGLRIGGAFSVNREGPDRKAINEAIGILEHAERPLLIFPEGTTSRTNDRLMNLMDGPGFIARTAAKRRAKKNGKVVCHPLAIKYFFRGDIHQSVDAALADIESRLTWRSQSDLPLIDRLAKVGDALLAIKELEYGIRATPGMSLRQRQSQLVNHLLKPLEDEWLAGGNENAGVALRIKNLRVQIFPEMSQGKLSENERERRWRQLEDTYLAQQIDCYPERYVAQFPSVDRALETVEKFEEDLTDQVRVHGNLKVVLQIGEPIEISPNRDRQSEGEPMMDELQLRLNQMLGQLQTESQMLDPKDYGTSHVT